MQQTTTASVDSPQQDLSDPFGIAKELASEAVLDVKEGIEDAAERFRYEKYLLEHSKGPWGNISRFARQYPIGALFLSATAAFFIGTRWKFR